MGSSSMRSTGFGSGRAWKGSSHQLDALKAFWVSLGSADRDLYTDRATLEKRSRALYQNAAFAGAAINSMNVNVVGSGLKCHPSINAEMLGFTKEEARAWEKSTQLKFSMWGGSKFCDAERKNTFAQLQDLAFKTQLITGDCFVLRQFRENPITPWGCCFKLLEGDRCMNPLGVSECDLISMGVEVDSLGAPMAYHFSKKPPYSIDNYSDWCETIRVETMSSFGMLNVIHIFSSDRPDQRRGVPWLAPVILQIKQQERYQDAELTAAVVASMFTIFIKNSETENPDPFVGNVPERERIESTETKDGLDQAAIEMSPGGINQLGKGESIETADPKRPNVNYDPFVNSIFTEIGARLGVASEVILKKFTTSYNAVRAAILESKKTFDRGRANLISDFCQPSYEAWLDESVLLGLVECPGYFEDPMKRILWRQTKWVGDAPMMLDPTKETQAFKMQIDEQLTTRGTVCAQINGDEYENVAANLAEEANIRTKFGLPEPGSVSKTESVSIATTETDSKKDEGENQDEEK